MQAPPSSHARLLVLTTLALLLLAGCGKTEEPAPAEAVYSTRGVYVGPQYGGQAAVIDHEAIPGTMEAMRMTFRLEDAAALAPLTPGDKVAFDLVETESGYVARRLERLPDTTTLTLPDADTTDVNPSPR